MKTAMTATLISFCLFLSACQFPAEDCVTTFDLDAAKNVIQLKNKQFTDAHITGDVDFLNSVFAKDAKVMAPNADVVTGRSAIEEVNREWVSYGIKEFDEVSAAIYGDGSYLIDEGTYHLVYGDDDAFDEGKYVNVWKMEDGEWKMYTNIWNTSLPATTAD